MQIITLLLIALLTFTEVDIFIPSFPEIQEIFNLSPFMVELTLGLNFTAYCFGSLITASLGDRYGRKPIIIAGLLIFICGSILCLNVTYFWMMLIGRILQGLGIAGPSILAYVVIADNYPPEEQVSVLGLFNGFVTAGMAFAPFMGSYLALFFGWRSNFLALLILGIICLVACIFFIPYKRGSKDVSLSLRAYAPIFTSSKCRTFVLSIALLAIPYWIFVGMAPILYMEDLGVQLKHFGYYQGFLAGAYAIFSFTSGYFIKRFGSKNCLHFSIILWIVACCLLALLSIFKVSNPILITAVATLCTVALVFPNNILWPLALEVPQGAKARMAGAINAAKLLLCAIGIQLASYYYYGNFKGIAFIMLVSLVFGLIITFRLLSKNVSFSGRITSLQ